MERRQSSTGRITKRSVQRALESVRKIHAALRHLRSECGMRWIMARMKYADTKGFKVLRQRWIAERIRLARPLPQARQGLRKPGPISCAAPQGSVHGREPDRSRHGGEPGPLRVPVRQPSRSSRANCRWRRESRNRHRSHLTCSPDVFTSSGMQSCQTATVLKNGEFARGGNVVYSSIGMPDSTKMLMIACAAFQRPCGPDRQSIRMG
jgi:hypothetical protein